MRPFNLKAAQSGENVCTRDGRPAVIKKIFNSSFMWRVFADVLGEDNQWHTIKFNSLGHEFGYGESKNDLFML